MNNKLSSIVQVRQNSIRSVNIERDLQNATVANGYVLTAQSLASLTRILDGLGGVSSSRAWTLTGPYGSGKSYFNLFLMNLISAKQSAHRFSIQQLEEVDSLLVERAIYAGNTNGSKGLLPIPITGYRAPLLECLMSGLQQALQPFAALDEVKAVLNALAEIPVNANSRVFTQLLQLLLSVVTQSPLDFHGVLLIFDELGKSLEHAANHPTETDIYLLQELAEFANRSSSQPFVFIGILHQAFERYATFLDSSTQREWAKVQGRFEDIAFQEPPTQQMRLLVKALDVSTEYQGAIEPIIGQITSDFLDSGWKPPLMRVDELSELCKKAYPLHPTVLIALPYVFRRLAQNERSIFAFLASYEPLGFQAFLDNHILPEFLCLADVFDYLVANFQTRLYASGRAHILTETVERLNNAPFLESLEVDVLKTIGMVNWLGEVSHVQATETVILAALKFNAQSVNLIRNALNTLKDKKMVVYRRFNQTFTIWQGSDVDIDERLEDAHRKISSTFSLAEAMQNYLQPHPFVARRHSYQTGTLRYFEVQYVDSHIQSQIALERSGDANGLLLLCLPTNYSEAEFFSKWAQEPPISDRHEIIVGVASRTVRLAELMQEIRYLQWISEYTPELKGDLVARRELRARQAVIEALINNELENSLSLYRLDDPAFGQWFYLGKRLDTQLHKGLTHVLSEICDALYPQTPRLWNELINRRTLSSQGAAARRNLIEGLIQRSDKENLGIEKYPPERSMYASLIKASGLHRQNEHGEWILTAPLADDPLNLRPVWDAIAEFVFQTPIEPRGIDDLYNRLSQPPYGLTGGVLPVFLCVFLLVHQEETTFYREGSLRPELEIADWEVLLRRPELFSIAGCRVEGPRVAILERFGLGLGVKPRAMPVVRTLIRSLKTLPDHAWRTQRLPEEVLAVRRAIETARSPERLIFLELPEALQLPAFDEDVIDEQQIEIYFERLNGALQALANVTFQLRDRARDQFLEACTLPIGDEGWQMFLDLSAKLLRQASNPAILPLLRRAVETSDSRAALESALAFIANRPLRTWTDADTDRFTEKAQYFGELFRIERNGSFSAVALSPEKRQRSQEIADQLQHYLEALESDPQILEAAFQWLIQNVRSTSLKR